MQCVCDEQDEYKGSVMMTFYCFSFLFKIFVHNVQYSVSRTLKFSHTFQNKSLYSYAYVSSYLRIVCARTCVHMQHQMNACKLHVYAAACIHTFYIAYECCVNIQIVVNIFHVIVNIYIYHCIHMYVNLYSGYVW